MIAQWHSGVTIRGILRVMWYNKQRTKGEGQHNFLGGKLFIFPLESSQSQDLVCMLSYTGGGSIHARALTAAVLAPVSCYYHSHARRLSFLQCTCPMESISRGRISTARPL